MSVLPVLSIARARPSSQHRRKP